MIEKGIAPPPINSPLIDDQNEWFPWDIWFRRITTAMPKVTTYTQALNPAAVAAQSTSEQIFTVQGLQTTDIVTVNKPSHTAGLGIVNVRVSAANSLAITFMNVTAGSIDPPSESYLITTTRR